MKNVKKESNKGFTLIELLSVIIVLAIIMVIAIPSVLDTTNAAKKKSFQLYGQRVMEKATEYVSLQQLTDDNFTNQEQAFVASDIGLDGGSYSYCVQYEPASTSTGYSLYLYMSDGTLCYNGARSDNIGDEKTSAGTANTDSGNGHLYVKCTGAKAEKTASGEGAGKCKIDGTVGD